MKKYILYLAAAMACFGLNACYSEDDLTPSDPMTIGNFPQGNNDYDQEFVAFYNKYNTQVLYEFEESDFRWNVTSNIPYYAEVADKSYIADAWELLDTYCFSIWSEEFLQKFLPYRILLASKLYSLKETWGYDSEGNYGKIYLEVPHNAMYGFNHITFGVTNSTLAGMSVEQKKQLVGDMAFALVGSAVYKGKMEIPTAFNEKFHEYYDSGKNSEWPGVWGYNGGGFLEYSANLDVYYDFALYVKYLVMLSKEEYEARFLTSSFDCGGSYDSSYTYFTNDYPIRKKTEMVLNYFKEQLGIDLNAIGARVSTME